LEDLVRYLAIIALLLWYIGSVVFFNWKKRVVYPKRPDAVVFTSLISELAFLALAVWVILS
jgi:hypothetical protein